MDSDKADEPVLAKGEEETGASSETGLGVAGMLRRIGAPHSVLVPPAACTTDLVREFHFVAPLLSMLLAKSWKVARVMVH